MAIITCKECGEKISSKSKQCPKCGHERKGFFHGCGTLSLILFISFCIVCCNIAISKDEMKKPPELITQEKFVKIKTGMTYQQVNSILGKTGVLDGENNFSGVSGFVPDINTVMYSWNCDKGFSGITCLFQNGVLVQKNQIGLK